MLTGTNVLFAEDPAGLKPFLRKTTSWECKTLNKEVPVNIYYITRSTHSRPWNIGSPVLVYIKNHGEERIGTEPVSIHFAPEMDEKSVTDGEGVKIIRMSNNKPVKGTWEISRHSTKFTFTPEIPFKEGEKYRVVVSKQVKNKAGTPLAEEKISEFKCPK